MLVAGGDDDLPRLDRVVRGDGDRPAARPPIDPVDRRLQPQLDPGLTRMAVEVLDDVVARREGRRAGRVATPR